MCTACRGKREYRIPVIAAVKRVVPPNTPEPTTYSSAHALPETQTVKHSASPPTAGSAGAAGPAAGPAGVGATAGLQRTPLRPRLLILPALDAGALAIGWLAIDAVVVRPHTAANFLLPVAAIVIQLVAGASLSLYRGRFVVGSEHELGRQGLAAVVVIASVLGLERATVHSADVAWLLLSLLSAQAIMVSARQLLRAGYQRGLRPRNAQAVVIVGAGELGVALIAQMQGDPESRFRPVAIVDDDPAKANLLIRGVPVCGGADDIALVVSRHGATGVVVAIAHAPATVFESVVDLLDLGSTWVRTVPTVNDLLDTSSMLTELRDIDLDDLIGRPQATVATADIAGLVADRTVLVTGAGGSIGSELCRIIHRHAPRRLIMLDRDESELHALCMSLRGRALMDSPDLVLADIRDASALHRVLAAHRPEIVVHAAALKHLPMLERYPDEGWKTNVHGTLNVLEAAAAHGVRRFVNISTDKAANPCSELGRSKFLAERLTAHVARTTGLPYVSVRFGNVLGSRGSVLVSFSEQIRRGGPVTVTHPDVTRYFMSIPEACQLVLQAAAAGTGGNTMVLDMGAPVRIVDLARRAMAVYGRTCPIEFTGLRAGEKLHEELFSGTELRREAPGGAAWQVAVSPLDPRELAGPDASCGEIRAVYARCVGPNGMAGAVSVADGAALRPATRVLEQL